MYRDIYKDKSEKRYLALHLRSYFANKIQSNLPDTIIRPVRIYA